MKALEASTGRTLAEPRRGRPPRPAAAVNSSFYEQIAQASG